MQEEGQKLDNIVLQLRDEFAADRARVRHAFMWLITFLIFAVFAAVVIVLGAGIAMLRQTGAVVENMEWLEGQMTAQTLQLSGMSNRVSQLTRGQLDLGSRMNRWQLDQQQGMDALRNDAARHSRWIAAREMQIERERSGLDLRLQQRGEVLDQLVASVGRLQARMDEVLTLGGDIVVTGGATPSAGKLPASGGGDDQTTESAPLADRPAWSVFLDSFDGAPLCDVFVEVLSHVDKGTPDPGISRMISVVEFPNGDRYEGTFENGLMHGWGIYTRRNGERYEGQFEHDLRHGNGTLILADGTRYEGDFIGGIRQGLGSLAKVDGSRYAGAFGNDMINGRGIMLYPDGGQYAGDFLNGQRHGSGLHRFANGDMYQGEFRQDKRTGVGVYVFADGSRYEGAFVDGVRHGRGHYVFADGTEFIGEFKNGQMHGEGLRISGNRRMRGVWHEGKHVRDLGD